MHLEWRQLNTFTLDWCLIKFDMKVFVILALFISLSLAHVAVIIKENRKTSNISRTIAGNKIVDHSDVVGASPVGAAPTTSSFST